MFNNCPSLAVKPCLHTYSVCRLSQCSSSGAADISWLSEFPTKTVNDYFNYRI